MRFPDTTGLLLTIVDGFIKDETITLQTVDNYHNPFGDFLRKVQGNNHNFIEFEDDLKVPRIYIIAGHKDKINYVEQIWRNNIKQTFDKIIEGEQIFKKIKNKICSVENYCLESFYWIYLSELITTEYVNYPLTWKGEYEDTTILAFYWSSNPSNNPIEEVNRIISFWISLEKPMVKGYQCLTQSFILKNLHGRKVLATIPDNKVGWGLVLEGGVCLPLAYDFKTGISKLNSSHIHKWTIGEIEEILLNPLYAFGYYFQHMDLVSEWFYVFLYVLGTIDESELQNVDFEFLYRRFCKYISKHICPYIHVKDTIIEMNQFILVLKRIMDNIRNYLKGEEEPGISKNVLIMMRNRYNYLPVVHQFIQKECGIKFDQITNTNTFDYTYWQRQLNNLASITSSYKKGIYLEKLIQYMLGTVPGLKVTDVRAKRARAEVDILCCNRSHDSILWKLGALILIECKNRNKKVSVADIRNIVPTMEAKGIHAAIIVSKEGFSSVANEEIKYQLSGGKIIIPISMMDLMEVGCQKSVYDLIKEKIETSESLLMIDDRLLYF